MTEIVLCATQRCGSTMIVEDMRNTGALGIPEEWFIPWDPKKTDINWTDNLAGVRNRASSENGVMAIKVMANQLHNIEACLQTFLPTSTGPLFSRFYNVFKDATWVWIRRTDVVAQAVSRLMAQQTGVNHATDGEKHFAGNMMIGGDRANYNKNTQYKYEAVLKECTSITLETIAWGRFFQAFDITPLILTYEDVIMDSAMLHLDAMHATTGNLDPLVKTARTIKKLGNSRSSDFVERFHIEAADRQFR